MISTNRFSQLLLCMIIATLLFIAVQFFLQTYHDSTKAVTFDLNATTRQFETDLRARHLTAKANQLVSKQFAMTLSSILKKYAVTHHAVIIKRSQALASDEDITSDIQRNVADAMHEASSLTKTVKTLHKLQKIT